MLATHQALARRIPNTPLHLPGSTRDRLYRYAGQCLATRSFADGLFPFENVSNEGTFGKFQNFFCIDPLRRYRRNQILAPAHRRSLLLAWASTRRK
jgi:hypothetical protein